MENFRILITLLELDITHGGVEVDSVLEAGVDLIHWLAIWTEVGEAARQL